MSKRKILMLALSVCMVAILAVGGTLAYFVDTDSADNVFTVGNVDIKLNEEGFGLKDDEYREELAEKILVPVTYDEDGERIADNVLDKIVTVTNTGTNDAFVRIHYAIPACLVDPYMSYNDSLHVNFTRDSIVAGEWCWHIDNAAGAGWVDNGAEYNQCYKTNIGGVDHWVWVVTYRTKLAKDETTATPAITQFYLDAKVTNEKIAEFNEIIGGAEWTIKVIAEGAQADGFDTGAPTDAYTALNTAFGVPSTASNPFNNYGAN